MNTPVKDRLKKKANKKKNEESSSESTTSGQDSGESDIFQMLGKVSEILKQNPEMLQKVNKCVSNIIDNKDLMDKLSSQIKDNMKLEDETIDLNQTPSVNVINDLMNNNTLQSEIQNIVTQTLESNEATDSSEAS
jgi:hypothetical protein